MMLAATGRFPWRDVGPYVVAQLLGAAAGALLVVQIGVTVDPRGGPARGLVVGQPHHGAAGESENTYGSECEAGLDTRFRAVLHRSSFRATCCG